MSGERVEGISLSAGTRKWICILLFWGVRGSKKMNSDLMEQGAAVMEWDVQRA